MGLYGEYAEEILNAADSESVFRQIQQFMDMLLAREYSYGVFCQKLPGYLDLIAEWDGYFSQEAKLFFDSAMEKREEFEKYGDNGCAFFCGWFLTLLMFHALSGNGEGESAMSRLRQDSTLHIENIGRTYLKKEKPQGKALLLTGRNTELCSSPLSRQHFFGREKEMFELRRMLIHGGKYLISGMGGIGKTELMRQLLKCCEEETLVDYICAIQYEGSLSASFVKAFPQIRGDNMEENFCEALACIRVHEEERVLVVIDNMNQNRREELAVLASLPATVFVTSRCQEFEGFSIYSVPMPDRSAARLIFHDNYEKAMNAEDEG
ncbi:MAG: ATP-binding protein, partial [Acetatifactor sp.]